MIPGLPIQPSPICLGTADFGGDLDQAAAFSILDTYIEQGGNFLDTASVYANWVPGNLLSSSEKIIGCWLKQHKNRHKIVLATKGGHPDLSTMHISRLSRAEIEADLHASLRNLQTDVIDLYWLHRDDPAHPVEDILTTLNDAVQAGKIRTFGCSNWRVERLRAANDYAAAHHLQGFAASQVLWNLAVVAQAAIGDPTTVVMDDALWEYHRATGLPAIPFSATANGFFNKLARGGFGSLSPLHQKMYAAPENIQRFESARQLAQEKGISITQVVLGYLLSQPFPVYPIIGPKRIEHLLDSLGAASSAFSASDFRFVR
jgi:aryl-alcohol dehydrogenase-like predicted oxidoreductase